jgi:dTDP-4-dehydrorhamnose reductase
MHPPEKASFKRGVVKVLLLGKQGQVGWELQRSLAPLGDVVALSASDQSYCGDVSNLKGIADTVRQIRPGVIVNAAAYTAVDKAEAEPDLARVVNAEAAANLAKEAKVLDAILVHYSTDYVFDGQGTKPWVESDTTNPLSVYGATKLAGEEGVQASGCQHIIFRTSWVYAARGNNFAKTMLRLATERDELSVIDDQFGAPTGAELLADVTAHVIQHVKHNPELAGLYHLAASGETTWHDYACFVINFARESGLKLKVASDKINRVSTSAFPTPATRPGNSRLDTSKLESSFKLTLPHWQSGVARMLTEILEKE